MTYKKVTLLSNENTTEKIPVKDLGLSITKGEDNTVLVPNAAGTSGNIANGVTYSPAQMDILALLFGGTVDKDGNLIPQDIYKDCTSVEDALEVDKETYFLGFASDFCAFIEGDFTATDADAEGRVAVGGNLRFDWDERKWNYQIGSGDYEVMSPLDRVEWTDDYRNVYGFASALVGGQMFRINTLSTGNKNNNKTDYRHINPGNNTAYYQPDEGLYKYFLVSGIDGFLHYDEISQTDIPYNTVCKHDYPSSSCAKCNSDTAFHKHLESINELSQMYIYNGIRDLIKDTFAYIRSRSDTLAQMQSIKGKAVYTYDGKFEKVLFDATGVPENTKTVYFTIDDWKDEYMKIEFVNIPEGANIVVNCKESGVVKIASDGNGGGKGDVITSINGTIISKNGLNDQDYKNAGNANNHPDSARILYNFYNTPELHIDGCFNGTVLCPYADAYSKKEECTGHLSGALIAKSFYGGLEFGYRPYRGSSDIFGMSSGYEIPVDKLFAGTKNPLPGAMFQIVELEKGKDNSVIGENIISLFESANKTNIISLPTYIDFSGDTYYIAESVISEDGFKEVTDNKDYGENVVNLSSPLEVYAYITGNYNDGDLIGNTPIPLQGKFYIKGTQVISLDGVTHETTPVYAYSNSGADRYEVYLSKIITSSDLSVTVKVKDAVGTEKDVTVNFIPIGITLTNKPNEAGKPISFQVKDYNSTDGIQFKYYYSTDGTNYTEIPNMNGTSGSFTPQSAGTYTIKAQAWYNNKPIAEAVSESVTVSAATNPYITVSNESPRKGDTITVDVADIGSLSITQWQVSNGNVNNGSLYLQNTGNYQITATLSDGRTVTKEIYVNDALNPYIWISNEQVNTNETIQFNVYDLPSDVKVNNWNIGNFANGNGNSGSFTPTQAGTYTLTVNLSNGNQLTKQITVKQPQADTSQMKLVATSVIGGTTNFYKGVKINFSVEGASSSNIQYKVFYNDSNDITSYMDSSSSITPASAGKFTITATVDGVAVPNQVIISIPDYVLTISPSSNSVGEEVSLSVQNIPSSKVTKIDYYIVDGDYHLGTDNNPLDSEPFKFKSAQAGDYTVKAVITFDGGGTSSVTASMHTTDQENHNAVQFSAAPIVSFSMGSNISVLSAETNVQYDNNKIIITSVDEEYIGRVRLNTLYANYDYSIKAVLYSGETQISEQAFTRDQIQGNSYWADINCNLTDKITKIEVEAVAGSVSVKDCHVTWLEPCKNVVKTYPANGEVSDTGSYTIILEESLNPEDFTLKFVVKSVDNDNNVNFVLDLYDSDGNKLTYNNGSDGKWTVTDGLFTFSQKGIVLDNNKKLNSDVAKIVISSGDGSKFKVGYYTVSSIVDKDDTITTVPTDTVVEEHTYIIREDTAPQGFVKSDKNYKVVIKETISLNDGNIEDNRLPKVSKATITIYESVDGATFTEKSDYTSAEKYKEAFEATLEIFNDYQKNIRTIKYGDNTFVIDRNDLGEVKSFTVNGSDGVAVVQDLNKPQQFEIGEEGNEQRFYYNPVTAMVVPFPKENLEYENAPGLHFQKVDDIGLPVKGADIILQVKDENGTYVSNEHTNSVWSWSDKSIQTAIDVSKLEPANIYRFYEETSPEGYERSDPIYFKVVKKSVDEKTKLFIHYDMKEADLDTEDKYTELDITENRVIKMTDSRILGAKLKLKKVKEDGTTFLEGAVFNLYSDDGTETLIKKDIKVDKETGVEVNLTENVEPNILNYVENGYLKPGMYFLTEATVPNGYKNPGVIRFVVRADFSIKFIDDNSGGSAADEYIQKITSLDYHIADAWGNLKWYSLLVNDTIVMDEPFGDKGAPEIGFANVQKIEVEFGSDTSIEKLYIDNGEYKGKSTEYLSNDVKDGKLILTFDTPRDIYQFKAAASEFSIKSIKFTDKKGRVIGFPSTQSGGSEGNESSTPVINHTVDNESDVKILTLGNTPDNGKVDIPIQKLWLNDNSFAAFRPDVTIKLYRTKTEFTDYSSIPEDGEQVTENGNPVQVILNAGNNWTHTFYNIDSRYQDENNEYKPYYFYLVEESCDGYKTPVYNKKTDGTLTVTNELDSVDIPVVKHLINPDNISTANPKSITLKLQVQVGENEWATVEGKTITLSPECDWEGKITGLLRGKKYRLTEDAVVGWEIDKKSQEVITINTTSPEAIVDESDLENDIIGTLELTNKPKKPDEGSIQLEKDWNTTEDLPSSVYFKLFRVAKKFYPPQTVEQVQKDYARLLQYSLYFYDANMCGDDVDENSALPWRDDCHEEDATNAIAGGYHDAGDHVMFGLPQGYSATMLGWSLYEFNTTAPDGEKVYDNLNQTAHYKIISDRFNDFFAQCIKEIDGTTKILVQKGDGDIDHKLWGAPETQQDRTNEMIWSDKGSDIAAEYAASLALSYLNFYRDDLPEAEKTKYKNHLAAAKKLYDFATTANRGIYSNGFYPSNSDNDDKALAAGWLYLATVKEGRAVDRYRNECNVTETKAITWDEVHIAAACVKAHIDGNWDSVANNYANVSEGKGICYNTANTYYEGPHNWGTARHNALSQTVALAIAKNLKENNPSDARAQKIADWCKTQMNFILGGNTWKDGSPVCLVTGFSEISTKYAHHRAASGWDDHEAYKINPTYDSDGHIIIGALAGGPAFKGHDDQQQMIDYGHDNCVANHTYLDDLHDYCCNEVALDYNAGLVGAAAGLYYFFKTGHTYEIPGVDVQYLQPEDEEADPVNMFYALSLNLLKGTRVMADESMYTFVGQHDVVSGDYEHNKDYKCNVSSITGNNTIDLIEFVFDGAGSITGHIVPNNEWNSRYEPSNAPLVDNILSITTFPKNIVELWINNWGSNVNLVQIRFYTAKESGGGGNVTPTYTVTGAESMTVNATETFTVSGMSGNIKWTYQKDNGNIITITDNGGTSCQFIPTEAGSYVITATDSSGNSASATVTVTQQQQQNFTLNIDNGEININAETYLRPNPGDNVSYSYVNANGDQDGLQIENNGKVTGLKAGTYTITASRDNGSQTATINLTVRAMSLNTPTTEITVGGNGTQWSINNPANNSSINWSSENTNVATVDSNGNITAVSAGDAVIKAVVSYNGNNVTFQNTIKVTGNSSSGGESGGGSTGVETPVGYIEVYVKDEAGRYLDDYNVFESGIPSELASKTIDYIIIQFSSDGKGEYNGGFYYNGNQVKFKNRTDSSFNYVSNDILHIELPFGQTISSVSFDQWYNGANAKVEAIYFYSKKPMPTITGATTVMVGNTINFTAENFDGTDITWSVVAPEGGETNLATIDQNGKLTANDAGTVKVVATRGSGDDAQTANATVTIIPFDFGFVSDSSDFKVHVGKELTIPFDTDRNVTMTIKGTNNGNVELNGNTFKGIASTEGQKIGFEATCSGKTITGTIEVVPDLSISGESKTYTGRKLSLTANNAVGNVTWSILDAGGTEATISQSGVLTAGGKAGTVKVQITDDEMTSEIFEIVIQPGCAEVDIEGMTDITHKFAEEGKNVIELTAADNWSKLLSGLEVYDANRDYYCYYIVECDEYGNPINSGSYVTGSNGAMFVPTSYKNNGATIEKGQTSVIEVSNALSAKVQGQMPSTGGDGTTTYYCFGAFIMLLSAAGFIGLRRRQRSQRSE
ncbi:MAG: glycoside hydrolase family 9 protein [Ruminococcus sp.]|nr:glycoside hydrolase family 9 protein [Ruminococcus sp.]